MQSYNAREYYPRPRQIVREYAQPEYYYDDADYYYPRAYGRRYYNDYYGGYYGPGIGFDVGTPLGGFGFGLGF
ncbi:spore coat protein [Candidatus Dependentiae bacterium]|nr:spore coat protein [Candidatus Dependentiae bacterium]